MHSRRHLRTESQGPSGTPVRRIKVMIEPGQAAPDFEPPGQDGNPVRLADLRGQCVVLYFYPKADTPAS